MQQLAPRWPEFLLDPGLWEHPAIFRVDGNYLYRLGANIHSIVDLSRKSNAYDIFYAAFVAEGALEPFIQRAAFGVRTCLHQGQQFLEALRAPRAHIEPLTRQQESQGQSQQPVMVPMLEAIPEPPPPAQVPTGSLSATGAVTP